jgi:hypothetical protein
VFSFDIFHAPIRTVLIFAVARIDARRADVEGVNPCHRKQFRFVLFESFESADGATIGRAASWRNSLDRHFNATSAARAHARSIIIRRISMGD